MARPEPRHHRDRQGAHRNRRRAQEDFVAAPAFEEIEPERIQEMIVVVGYPPEHFPKMMKRREIFDRPDFIEPQRPASAPKTQDEPGGRNRRDSDADPVPP